MVSKIVVILCLVAATNAAIPAQAGGGNPWAGSGNPWLPSWIANAPWMPTWVPCDQATQTAPACNDCTTRLICTKIGGLLRACTDPALPHCDLGQCVAEPSAQCAPPAEAVPAEVVPADSA